MGRNVLPRGNSIAKAVVPTEEDLFGGDLDDLEVETQMATWLHEPCRVFSPASISSPATCATIVDC